MAKNEPDDLYAQRCVAVAAAMHRLQQFVDAGAPEKVQLDAMELLVRRVAATQPRCIHEVTMLLLNVADATEALKTGTKIPNTAEELEALFRKLPNNDKD